MEPRVDQIVSETLLLVENYYLILDSYETKPLGKKGIFNSARENGRNYCFDALFGSAMLNEKSTLTLVFDRLDAHKRKHNVHKCPAYEQ